jgi:hypothetical protein
VFVFGKSLQLSMIFVIRTGANVIKLFTDVSYDFIIISAFVPGKPYQPSLMFVGKAGAYLSEATFRCSTLG